MCGCNARSKRALGMRQISVLMPLPAGGPDQEVGGAVKRLVKKPANPLHLESRTDPGIDVRVSTTRAKQRGIVQSPGQEAGFSQ